MSKPKWTYADFVAAQQVKPLNHYKPGTVAALLERYINEMNGWAGKPAVREIGGSQLYALRSIQRWPFGAKDARSLTKHDIKAFVEWRSAGGSGRVVKPATVTHDLSSISVVLNYAGSEWDDCDGISDAALKIARPGLVKRGMVAKSEPRTRRPTMEELETLMWHFNIAPKKGRRFIDMATLTWWQPASGRRVGESCDLRWVLWNRDAHTILVRKMKDPRRKKDKVVALTDQAQRFLEIMWDQVIDDATKALIANLDPMDPAQPLIFPFNKRSVIAAYCVAKKKTGIDGLHLHDSRRETSTRLAEEGFSSAEAIQFTGHETPREYERTYLKLRPEDVVRNGPASKRKAQSQANQ